MNKQLLPGRELDAFIAEKVMGLRPFKKKWQQGIHDGYLNGWIDLSGHEIEGETKPYSTDIAAAWEVMEKLQSNGLYPKIELGCGGHWMCEILGMDPSPLESEWTAPHAICLAALKAVGVEVE